MYCTSCGKEVREGATFCTSCGTKINSNISTLKTKKKIQTPIVAGIVIVFIVFGGIFAAKMIMPNMGQSEERVSETELQKSVDTMSSVEGMKATKEDVKVAGSENVVEPEIIDVQESTVESESVVAPEVESEKENAIDASYVYALYKDELQKIKENGLYDIDKYYYSANKDLYYGYYDMDKNGVKELLFDAMSSFLCMRM